MASTIQVTGKQPSARAAIILANVDYADLIASDDLYNTGGETYAALVTALEGLTWKDMPFLIGAYYFKINASTLKIMFMSPTKKASLICIKTTDYSPPVNMMRKNAEWSKTNSFSPGNHKKKQKFITGTTPAAPLPGNYLPVGPISLPLR